MKSTVNSDDLPGSGEHYLDPARIDAKSSETRMTRRGDVVDSHASGIEDELQPGLQQFAAKPPGPSRVAG